MTRHHLVIRTGIECDAIRIVTDYLSTPTGARELDWMAYCENWEMGDPVGHGATEQEAIHNLREELESRVCPPWQ